MCTSTDDCFCHEQVRQSLSPCSSVAQRTSSSAERLSASIGGVRNGSTSSVSGSCRLLIVQQHLLQRVAAETEAQGLERDDLVGRDVSEVHSGAELLDEPDLCGLRRR